MGSPPASGPSSQTPTGTLADTDELVGTVSYAEPGASVSRYVVLERIGMGGVGVVYAAYDPELDRKVAIKLLQVQQVADERTSMGGARLLREAQALARLTHPNVVTVHDVGTWNGRVFVAMEFVRGRTLSRWIADTSPNLRAKVDMFVQAGRGLAAAHAEGLVHRDFKPENVIVGDDGRARVLDFGLARMIGYAESEFLRVRDTFVEHKGEHHPDVLQVQNSLAATCHALRGASPCAEAFGRVIAAAEQVHGAEHPEVAGYANNYAIVLHELDRDVEAEASARRALAIRRKHFGEDHPGVGAALGVLGQIVLARGDLPAAREALDDALANLQKTRGRRHPDVVAALQGAAEVRVAQGERTDGLRLLEEALALATELDRPTPELEALRAAVTRARAM